MEREYRFKNEIETLIKKLYQIIQILCKDFRANQDYLYQNLNVFIDDIFKDYGAE